VTEIGDCGGKNGENEKNPPMEGLIRETLNVLHSHKGKGNIHNTSHGSYLIG
jgi:hypothetical protein